MKNILKYILIVSSLCILSVSSALHGEKVTFNAEKSLESQDWNILGYLELRTEKLEGKKVLVLDDQSTEDSIAIQYYLPSEILDQAIANGYKLSVSMCIDMGAHRGALMRLSINVSGQVLDLKIWGDGVNQALTWYDKELRAHSKATIPYQELVTWEIVYKPNEGVQIFHEGESLVPPITLGPSKHALDSITIGGFGGESTERKGTLYIEKLSFEVLE